MAALACALLLPLPLSAGSVFALAAGLLLFGGARGLLGVAMNKAAADHEQTLGRDLRLFVTRSFDAAEDNRRRPARLARRAAAT